MTTPQRKTRVLVVDDCDDLRKMLKVPLGAAGYQVIEAANGRVALDLAFDVLPDVLLLDIKMPVMNGLEVCRALRARDEFEHSVIIMLTADTEDREMGLEIGADHYMTKPFSPAELLRVIKKLYAQKLKMLSGKGKHTEARQETALLRTLVWFVLFPFIVFAFLGIVLSIIR